MALTVFNYEVKHRHARAAQSDVIDCAAILPISGCDVIASRVLCGAAILPSVFQNIQPTTFDSKRSISLMRTNIHAFLREIHHTISRARASVQTQQRFDTQHRRFDLLCFVPGSAGGCAQSPKHRVTAPTPHPARFPALRFSLREKREHIKTVHLFFLSVRSAWIPRLVSVLRAAFVRSFPCAAISYLNRLIGCGLGVHAQKYRAFLRPAPSRTSSVCFDGSFRAGLINAKPRPFPVGDSLRTDVPAPPFSASGCFRLACVTQPFNQFTAHRLAAPPPFPPLPNSSPSSRTPGAECLTGRGGKGLWGAARCAMPAAWSGSRILPRLRARRIQRAAEIHRSPSRRCAMAAAVGLYFRRSRGSQSSTLERLQLVSEMR